MITAKRMFTRCLREVVAEYALSPTDINTELCESQTILAPAGGVTKAGQRNSHEKATK